jgi:hypothetical protein
MTLLKFLSSTLATVALLATFSSAQADDREHYALATYTLKPANLPGLDEYLGKTWIPAATSVGAGPVGVFREAEANGALVVHVLTVLKSAAHLKDLTDKLAVDPAYLRASDAFFSSNPAGRPYDRVENSLFAAIDGMPKLAKPDTTKSRILNLRIYESPTPEAHAKKVEMFNTGELAIFKRVGLTPVMFGSALSGPRMPNLTYLLVFPDDEARKAAWKKFGPDPEWQTLKAKPGFSDKEIIRKITNILLTPAPYSEI